MQFRPEYKTQLATMHTLSMSCRLQFRPEYKTQLATMHLQEGVAGNVPARVQNPVGYNPILLHQFHKVVPARVQNPVGYNRSRLTT